MTFIVKNSDETPTVDFAANPKLETVEYDEKLTNRPRLPFPDVYSGPDDSRKRPSGKHRDLRCRMVPLPLGRMMSVPVEGQAKKSAFEAPPEDDSDAELEEVQVGSVVYRVKKPRPSLETVEQTGQAAGEPVEIDDLRNLVQEGGSKIMRNLQRLEKGEEPILEPQNPVDTVEKSGQAAGEPENLPSVEEAKEPLLEPQKPEQESRIRAAFRAILSAIYNFVLALFAKMRNLCGWRPTGAEIKA